MPESIAVSVKNVSKQFDNVEVLRDINLTVEKGTVVSILGSSGSGKSTLCKIFAGAESATSGEFYLDGQKLSFRNPTDAAKSGIVLVYQETSLVPTLTVMENIFMGRLPKKPGGLINWKLVQSETERLLKVMDVRINPKSKIMHLPMWQRQVVEICKALSQDPKVLILDEPTSALAKAEVEKLFAAIRKVKENDVIIIYISHKLAEIHEIADTVTVLRDAQYVGKKNIEEIDNAGMIAMMFGKTEIRKRPADVGPTDEPVMEVKHLTRAGWYEDISFTLYKGEVLGIAPNFHDALLKGLIGAGYTFKTPGPASCCIFTVKDSDKPEFVDIAWKLKSMGYKLYGTSGTCAWLNKHMVPCNEVRNMSGESPNIVDLLQSGLVDYVFSTSAKGRDPKRDSVRLRRKAVELSIPCITAVDTANALVNCLRSDHSMKDIPLVDIATLYHKK